jgi:hypothetical protein
MTQNNDWQVLHRALNQCKDIQCSNDLESRVWAQIEARALTPKIKNRQWLTAMMILSTPLWIWFAYKSQEWSINQLFWKMLHWGHDHAIINVVIHFIQALQPVEYLVLSVSCISLLLVYFGCARAMWYLCHFEFQQGLAS